MQMKVAPARVDAAADDAVPSPVPALAEKAARRVVMFAADEPHEKQSATNSYTRMLAFMARRGLACTAIGAGCYICGSSIASLPIALVGCLMIALGCNLMCAAFIDYDEVFEKRGRRRPADGMVLAGALLSGTNGLFLVARAGVAVAGVRALAPLTMLAYYARHRTRALSRAPGVLSYTQIMWAWTLLELGGWLFSTLYLVFAVYSGAERWRGGFGVAACAAQGIAVILWVGLRRRGAPGWGQLCVLWYIWSSGAGIAVEGLLPWPGRPRETSTMDVTCGLTLAFPTLVGALLCGQRMGAERRRQRAGGGAAAAGSGGSKAAAGSMWLGIARSGLLYVSLGGSMYMTQGSVAVMLSAGLLLSLGTALLVISSANDDVDRTIFATSKKTAVLITVIAVLIAVSNSAANLAYSVALTAATTALPCAPLLLFLARPRHVLAMLPRTPRFSALLQFWAAGELLANTITSVYMAAAEGLFRGMLPHLIVHVGIAVLGAASQLVIYRRKGGRGFSASVNSYCLSAGLLVAHYGAYPPNMWGIDAGSEKARSNVAFGLAMALPNALLLWRNVHIAAAVAAAIEAEEYRAVEAARRKNSAVSKILSYKKRRERHLLLVKLALGRTALLLMALGSTLLALVATAFSVHGGQGDVLVGAALLLIIVSNIMLVVSGTNVNFFGRHLQGAWWADATLLLFLLLSCAHCLALDRSPAFAICLLPFAHFACRRDSVIRGSGALLFTDHLAASVALTALSGAIWAARLALNAGWDAGMGLACVWGSAPLLLLSVRLAYLEREKSGHPHSSPLDAFQLQVVSQSLLASCGYLVIGAWPPPTWGVRFSMGWAVAGALGVLLCAVTIARRLQLTAYAASKFEKEQNADDLAFVSDLLAVGGSAAGAARELVELSKEFSPEAAKGAAEAIRLDSTEQKAYTEAAKAVRQALDSSEAQAAREQLVCDATAMDAAAIRGNTLLVHELFGRLQRLSADELARLDTLMVACRATYKNLLAVRWKQLEAIRMWESPVRSSLQKLPAQPLTLWGDAPQPEQRLSLVMSAAQHVNDCFQAHVAELVARFNKATHPADLGLRGEDLCLPLRNAAMEEGESIAECKAGPLKMRDRAEQKVLVDYAEYGAQAEAHLLDLVRVQVRVSDPYAAAVLFRFVEKDSQLELVRVKNKFSPDYADAVDEFGRVSEYKDLLLNARFRGHVCEIQVALADLAEMKRQSHKFYKVSRALHAGEIFVTSALTAETAAEGPKEANTPKFDPRMTVNLAKKAKAAQIAGVSNAPRKQLAKRTPALPVVRGTRKVRRDSTASKFGSYMARRRKALRRLQRTLARFGSFVLITGILVILATFTALVDLRHDRTYEPVIGAGLVLCALGHSLHAVSAFGMNYFGKRLEAAFAADGVMVLSALYPAAIFFGLDGNCPVFALCLLPPLAYFTRRRKVLLGSTLFKFTDHQLAIQALNGCSESAWALNIAFRGHWPIGFAVGSISALAPVLAVLTMHQYRSRDAVRQRKLRLQWTQGGSATTVRTAESSESTPSDAFHSAVLKLLGLRGLFSMLVGWRPPPHWGAEVGMGWIVGGACSAIASAALLLCRKRAFRILEGDLFAKRLTAKDRTFVTDLLSAGGSAAGAANELLEVVSRRGITAEEAAEATRSIRMDHAEQQAYTAARQKVDLALESVDAANARDQLMSDALLIVTSSLNGHADLATNVFTRMCKLGHRELRRLQRLMGECCDTLKTQLAVRFAHLEAIVGFEENGGCCQALPSGSIDYWGDIPQAEQRLQLLLCSAKLVHASFHEHIAALVGRFNDAQYPQELGLIGQDLFLPITNSAVAGGRPSAVACAAPLKTLARADEKVRRHFSSRTVPEAHLLDLVRTRVNVLDPYGAFVFFKLLQEDSELQLARVCNKFAEHRDGSDTPAAAASGYKDLVLNVRYRGHVCEVQVALADLAEMKSRADLYNIATAKDAGQVLSVMGEALATYKVAPKTAHMDSTFVRLSHFVSKARPRGEVHRFRLRKSRRPPHPLYPISE